MPDIEITPEEVVEKRIYEYHTVEVGVPPGWELCMIWGYGPNCWQDKENIKFVIRRRKDYESEGHPVHQTAHTP